MELASRIRSFEMLGDWLRRYRENTVDRELDSLTKAAVRASVENQWFTPAYVAMALNNLGSALQPSNLSRWLAPYRERLLNPPAQKTVGVVMAGNIPAVGFHDFLCVLISGNRLTGRLSSSDAVLIPAMAGILTELDPGWRDMAHFTTGRLEGFDAIIATGSDNTSRYFDFYFGKYPHIIRHNRNSVAILHGTEDETTLGRLAGDIMHYFGLGCRNVSKIYVPQGYDFSGLTGALSQFSHFTDHHKYYNNYEYSRSIFMVGQVPFTDAGCLLLREDPSLASRVAVLHYEYYDVPGQLIARLGQDKDSIQCIVSAFPVAIKSVLPGEAQNPAVWEYTDELDTLDFLLS